MIETKTKQLKRFSSLQGWSYKSSCSDGKVYWEVKFDKVLDSELINTEAIRKKIYNLPFEPASDYQIDGYSQKQDVSKFFGLYNVESLRRELELAEFKDVA